MTRLKWIGYIGLMVLTFGAGWTANGWRLISQFDQSEKDAAIAYGDLQKKYREIETARQKKIAELDKHYLEKLKNVEKKNVDTIAALHNGTLQLRERFQCQDTSGQLPEGSSSSGMGNEETRSGLRSEDAEFLVSEADRADRVAIQLQACQETLIYH